jgi:Flp pilus assembly protein TadG
MRVFTTQGRYRPSMRPGTASVEMALIVPILMLISFGMFELSRGWMAKNILNDAARKGCRTGIQPNKANSDITTDVDNILSDNGFDPTKATVTILLNGTSTDVKNAQRGDTISVQVSVPVSQTAWDGFFYLKGAQVESETLVMMRQS